MLKKFESGILESGILNLKLNKPRPKGSGRSGEAGSWLACDDGLASGFRRNDDMDTASGRLLQHPVTRRPPDDAMILRATA